MKPRMGQRCPSVRSRLRRVADLLGEFPERAGALESIGHYGHSSWHVAPDAEAPPGTVHNCGLDPTAMAVKPVGMETAERFNFLFSAASMPRSTIRARLRGVALEIECDPSLHHGIDGSETGASLIWLLEPVEEPTTENVACP